MSTKMAINIRLIIIMMRRINFKIRMEQIRKMKLMERLMRHKMMIMKIKRQMNTMILFVY